MSKDKDSTGIILFAHGSSVKDANHSVENLAVEVRKAGPYNYVSTAFLELANPNLSVALDRALRARLKKIIIVPYFLTLGVHIQQDLPRLVSEERHRNPGLEIFVTKPLAGHSLMASIILERACEINSYKPPSL